MEQNRMAEKTRYREVEPSKEEKLAFEITNLLRTKKVSVKSALTILEDVKDGIMNLPF